MKKNITVVVGMEMLQKIPKNGKILLVVDEDRANNSLAPLNALSGREFEIMSADLSDQKKLYFTLGRLVEKYNADILSEDKNVSETIMAMAAPAPAEKKVQKAETKAEDKPKKKRHRRTRAEIEAAKAAEAAAKDNTEEEEVAAKPVPVPEKKEEPAEPKEEKPVSEKPVSEKPVVENNVRPDVRMIIEKAGVDERFAYSIQTVIDKNLSREKLPMSMKVQLSMDQATEDEVNRIVDAVLELDK